MSRYYPLCIFVIAVSLVATGVYYYDPRAASIVVGALILFDLWTADKRSNGR